MEVKEIVSLIFMGIVGILLTGKIIGNNFSPIPFGDSSGFYVFKETVRHFIVGTLGVISLSLIIGGLIKLLALIFL